MNEYKPSAWTRAAILASFLAVVLPAIWFAGMGYMWLLEHRLKLDLDAKADNVADQVLMLVTVLPMIPLMLAAILVAGIPWMFVMSRILPWADIEHFTEQKGPRMPLLSEWLDRLWLHMIRSRRPTISSKGGPSDSSVA